MSTPSTVQPNGFFFKTTLTFSPPTAGEYRFEVSGFSSEPVNVYNILNPNFPTRLTGTQTISEGTSATLQFGRGQSANTRYIAVSDYQSPAAIILDTVDFDLRLADNAADHIIITHADFYTSAVALRDYHRGNGLRAEVVRVADVYDQFSDGIVTPQAIKDFLRYALSNWQRPAPTYVVLLGDSNVDYRNLISTEPTYVPTQIIEQQSGEDKGQTASDNWFVELVGNDVLPDMQIGRLPARTPTEAATMVNKIINYSTDSSWNQTVVLLADDGLNSTEPQFEEVSEQLAAELPFYYTPEKIYTEQLETNNGNPTQATSEAINQGVLLVNYAGHGGIDLWGNWINQGSSQNIFNPSNIEALQNPNRLPFVTVANCLSGFFVNSNEESMAESFMRATNAGAVGVWAPTWLDFAPGHRTLMTEFYQAIFQDDLYELGAATNAAKLQAYGQNEFWASLVQTFVLFGDPALSLQIEPNYPYLVDTFPPDGGSGFPRGVAIELFFSKPISTNSITIDDGGIGLTYDLFQFGDSSAIFNPEAPLYDYGQTVTLTVGGQDLIGNAIGTGTTPNPWSFTIEPAIAAQTVVITGPTDGLLVNPNSNDGSYTFNATLVPTDTTRPVTFTWQATDQETVTTFPLFGDPNINFTWETPGLKTLVLTATNQVGTASGVYYFNIIAQLDPVNETTPIALTYSNDDGSTIGLNAPIGTVDRALELGYTSIEQPVVRLNSIDEFAGQAFFLKAVEQGVILDDFTFQQPVELTINYTDADVAGLDESVLFLKYVADDGTWRDAAETCDPVSEYSRNPEANTLTVNICHLSQFALFESLQETYLYLPIMLK